MSVNRNYQVTIMKQEIIIKTLICCFAFATPAFTDDFDLCRKNYEEEKFKEALEFCLKALK